MLVGQQVMLGQVPTTGLSAQVLQPLVLVPSPAHLGEGIQDMTPDPHASLNGRKQTRMSMPFLSDRFASNEDLSEDDEELQDMSF